MELIERVLLFSAVISIVVETVVTIGICAFVGALVLTPLIVFFIIICTTVLVLGALVVLFG